MPATLKDVARRSGFSVTTVSRALNGHSDVNIETRKKIEQAARELNYFPNRMAQQLVTRKTNAIGLYSLDRETFQNQFIALMISGMMDEATTHDFNLLLFATQRLMTAEEMVIQCKQRGLGGAVISGLRTDEAFIAELPAVEFPIVLVDVPVEGPGHYVSVNNVLGPEVQSSTCLLGIPQSYDQRHDALGKPERLAGLQEGLLQHGLRSRTAISIQGTS